MLNLTDRNFVVEFDTWAKKNSSWIWLSASTSMLVLSRPEYSELALECRQKVRSKNYFAQVSNLTTKFLSVRFFFPFQTGNSPITTPLSKWESQFWTFQNVNFYCSWKESAKMMNEFWKIIFFHQLQWLVSSMPFQFPFHLPAIS